MKYAMCPNCGKRLCKGEPGSKVELVCPKCGKYAYIIIESSYLYISDNPLQTQNNKSLIDNA